MPEPTKEELEKQSADNLEALKKDEYMTKMFASTGKSMEQILEPEVKPGTNQAAKSQEETPEAKAARENAEADAAAAKVVADKAAADKAAEEQQKREAVPPVRPVVLQKRESPEDKKKLEEDASARTAREEEEVFVATLNLDRQDSVAVARFAETKGKPGVAKKLMDCYRRLDAFKSDNPEAGDDHEDYVKIVREMDNLMSPGEIRRMELAMVEDRATRKATDEVRREFEPVVKELNSMKNEPAIKSTLDQVGALLVKKPETGEAISEEVYSKIKSMPYDKAVEEYPVEAPIVSGTLAAAQEFTRIWNDVVPVNDKNPTHNWLIRFLSNEEAKIMALPKAEQMREGRAFMPLGQLSQLQRTNPGEASKYYTLDHGMVIDRLARHGVEQFNAQIKKLEKSGFARKPVEKKDDKVESKPGSTSTSGSPKATSHTMVGAGAEGNDSKLLDSLPPHMRTASKLMNTA